MSQYILVVDDDALLRQGIAYGVKQAGYRIKTAADAETGLAIARSDPPDLVLLDINMPGMSGLEALRFFRDQLGIPVIFLTARRRELDEILGLELGAEDYITKPFDPDVLLARIRTVLRRAEQFPSGDSRPRPLVLGDLEIDPAGHSVNLRGQPVSLSAREFQILYTLAQEAGSVVSADELLERVWGPEYVGESQAVYVYIRWLREKLEQDPGNPRRIVTIRSIGYKLVSQEG